MVKNYFFVLIGFFLGFSLFAQSPQKVSKDSAEKFAKAALTALDNNDYNKSIEYALELIDIATPQEDYYQLNRGHNFLGVTYEILEDSARAKQNYEKALDYAMASKNDTLLWYAYNNLGNIYSSSKESIEKGLNYYKKAIQISSRLPKDQEALTPIVNIGWTYLENHKYDLALPYLEQACTIYVEGIKPDMDSNLNTLYGIYHSGKGNYRRSADYFEKAIAHAEEDSLLIEASFAYEEYAKMLYKSRNFDKAYLTLEKYYDLKEEIFQKEKSLQQKGVYERYETEEFKKDLAAARREQQYKDEVLEKTQQITVIMVISLIIMFVFLILLFRNNNIRQKLIGQLRDKNEELIAAKEEAERLSLLKTRFFSTVSHELRTPLYGVVGLASLLLEENKDENQKEDLKSLKFSADYLLALINDVLQMNKMESNLVHLENSSFNIKELFEGIIKSFENTRHENKNRIELDIDPEIPNTLIGDAMRLSQIMMNLVGNAVKFTENGKIWLKAERRQCGAGDCLIYFEVGDTGMGIPENKQEEIFEEFSQLKTQNINYQGTGLGLPIVKKLLNLFGSDIHLWSEEAKGSIFSFEIKFSEAEENQLVPVGSGRTLEEVMGAVKKILIVDDNRINQVVTQRILEKRNFFCLIAGSGEEAIEILQVESPDIVLMDVNMPGMNGMETTVEIRKFNPEVPIIALTAVEVGEMREEILSAGMNDIINKPYDIPQFFKTIFRNLLQPIA